MAAVRSIFTLWKPIHPVVLKPDHILKRCFSQHVVKQDPEEVKNIPIFQYATERTKRSTRLYAWGNALYGALGNPNFLRPVHKRKSVLKSMRKPSRLHFSHKHRVLDVACGYGFTVIIASNDDTYESVFGTGLNTDFQIGYHAQRRGHPLEILIQSVPISLPLMSTSTRATHASCGRAHTIIISDREGVFSLGNNAYGQCGTHHNPAKVTEQNFRINKVEDFDENIIKSTCGQDHTMFLSKSGAVYSCGWGADGQTGLGHYKNQMSPAKVKGDIENEKISQLSCAADCVLAVSECGAVFGWGNSEYGQLNAVTDSQQMNVPRYLKLNNIGKVKQVASGGTMCALLTEGGRVYVWGYGILGQGPNVSHLSKPALLPPPLFGCNEFAPDVVVEQIACGLSHFAAVTNKGHLYMWGRNRGNCLGLGHENHQYFPFKVSVPAEVESISCGVDHTAALCRSFA